VSVFCADKVVAEKKSAKIKTVFIFKIRFKNENRYFFRIHLMQANG
jgi:hypothetical protein